ncbi:13114_t:CDS:2, partial [Ambispora leptoticha]
SEIQVEKKLEAIREHLKKPYRGIVRFRGKSPEQIAKERYDKILEEVNFDYEKLHAWIYDEKNKAKIEIVKLDRQDFSEATEAIFKYVKSNDREVKEALINEETGQVIYNQTSFLSNEPHFGKYYSEIAKNYGLPRPREAKTKKKNTTTLIFLHGTYGAGSLDQLAEKFPGLKVIHPHSPTLQYDMWHGFQPAPGKQCQG